MIYDEMREDIKELIALVRSDEQYNAAIAAGSVKPNQETSRDHEKRALRIDDLTRKHGAR
ncbi:hypothetical protein [Pseudomonas grimontii]|uniref:hypothetical protein n=1 Tax=Pseudomonas grimontii TaxID=129847 RepID=UPI00387B47C7